MTKLAYRQPLWRQCRRGLLVGTFAVPVLLGLGVTASSAEELPGQVASADLEESVEDADSGVTETVEHVTEEATASAVAKNEAPSDDAPSDTESGGAAANATEAVSDASDGEPAPEVSEAATEAGESVEAALVGAEAVDVDETVEETVEQVAEESTPDPISVAEDEVDVAGDVVDEVSDVVAVVTDSVDADEALRGAAGGDAVEAVEQVVDDVLIGAPTALFRAETAPIVDLVASTVEAADSALTTGTNGLFDRDPDGFLHAGDHLPGRPSVPLFVRRVGPGPGEMTQTASASDSADDPHLDQVDQAGTGEARPASGAPVSDGAPSPQLSGLPASDAMSQGSGGQSAAYLAAVFGLMPQSPHLASAIGPKILKTQHTLEPVVAPG